MRFPLIMIAAASALGGCASPAPSTSRSPRPVESSGEPPCHSCAKSFATRVVALHDARWRLTHIAIDDGRVRWRYGHMVSRFRFTHAGKGVELALSFGAGGTHPIGFAERSMPAAKEVRVYSVEVPFVRALRSSAPRALSPSAGGYTLTVGSAENFVELDPEGYYVVLESVAGANAAKTFATMLRSAARKRSLIAAHLDAAAGKARFVFAGREDRVIEVALDPAGLPTAAELRLARNTASERVASPPLEALLKQWLPKTQRVVSVRPANKRALTLVNDVGQALVLDPASFVRWERPDDDGDDLDR